MDKGLAFAAYSSERRVVGKGDAERDEGKTRSDAPLASRGTWYERPAPSGPLYAKTSDGPLVGK